MEEREPEISNGRHLTGSLIGSRYLSSSFNDTISGGNGYGAISVRRTTTNSANSGRRTASSYNSGRDTAMSGRESAYSDRDTNGRLTASSYNSGRDTANSGRQSTSSFNYQDGADDHVTGSRTGSAIDGTVNVGFEDSSDYHDYSSRYERASTIGANAEPILYKRRWCVLFVLCICVVLHTAVWGTWYTIAECAKSIFGWKDKMLYIIINCGNIGTMLSVLFTGPMISGKGLRVSMILCTFLLAIGSGLRIISRQTTAATILIGAGQFCNGLAGSITQVVPSVLSETWFPVKERTTATAIAVLSSSLGVMSTLLIGTFIVDPESQTNIEPDTESDLIWNINLTEFAITVLLFVTTVLFFPAKPPTPPSQSAKEEIESSYSFQGLKPIFRRPTIFLATVSCSIPWAVYMIWVMTLDVNLDNKSVTNRDKRLFGVYASAASILGGLILARIADRFQRHLKMLILNLSILALVLIIYITCMNNGYIYTCSSNVAFIVSITLLGTAVNSALSLCYEMASEHGFPVHEAVIGSAISLGINTASVIVLLIKRISNIGIGWINWTFVGVQAMGILSLLCFKAQYHRLNIDILAD